MLLCVNFQCTLMMIGDCNLAQLTAWAFRLCGPTSCALF